MSKKGEVRRSPDYLFLMTLEQYRQRAAALRASGKEGLAQLFDNLIRLRTDQKKIADAQKKVDNAND